MKYIIYIATLLLWWCRWWISCAISNCRHD